jgi:hypothetical protein
LFLSFIIAIRWINHDNKPVIDAEYLEHKLLNYVTSTADGKSFPGHHQQQRQQPAVGNSPQIRDQRSAERTSRYDSTYVGQEYDGLHTFQGQSKKLRT